MDKTNKLNVKDLVNIGVFSALYMVVSLILMVPAGFAPILWILWPAFAGLICGGFFTILMVKVVKFGPALLLCLITGILYFATGECTWIIVATCAIAGIFSEILRKIFGYKSYKGIVLAGGIAALGFIGSPLPMWLFQESYMKSILEMGMAQDYVTKLQSMISGGTLVMMIGTTFIGGIVGTMIGRRFMKKHFEKAGII